MSKMKSLIHDSGINNQSIRMTKQFFLGINKTITILLVALFFCFNLQAQDKKSKDLLAQVTAKIKSYDNITVDFKYTLNNLKENINKESKGNVILSGNKYCLNFLGVTKIFDGKKSYTI